MKFVRICCTFGLNPIRSKECLKDILGRVMDNKDLTCDDIYYEVHLRHWTAKRETLKKFGVLNSVMGSTPDASLASWAASEKLFPWVAVAAQIMICSLSYYS